MPESKEITMDVKDFFPIWNQLTEAQQTRISSAAVHGLAPKGSIIHNGSRNCTGLLLVEQGSLRAKILSENGREITIYRLSERDICLFSASCMMHSIQFEVTVEAKTDSSLWIIPADVYQEVMRESACLANFTNEIMATRFSDVMWLIEQILWKSMDKRLAGFLMEESAVENSTALKITHEEIANHLGTAREVVTRMLHYFQSEGMVRLSRGTVEIKNLDRLASLQAS